MRRIRTDFFVSAYRVTCEAAGAFVVIRAKGDATAGAVYIRVQTARDTTEIYEPVPNLDDPDVRAWSLAMTVDGEDEQRADAYVDGILKRDPDAWFVDVEAADERCRPEPIVKL